MHSFDEQSIRRIAKTVLAEEQRRPGGMPRHHPRQILGGGKRKLYQYRHVTSNGMAHLSSTPDTVNQNEFRRDYYAAFRHWYPLAYIPNYGALPITFNYYPSIDDYTILVNTACTLRIAMKWQVYLFPGSDLGGISEKDLREARYDGENYTSTSGGHWHIYRHIQCKQFFARATCNIVWRKTGNSDWMFLGDYDYLDTSLPIWDDIESPSQDLHTDSMEIIRSFDAGTELTTLCSCRLYDYDPRIHGTPPESYNTVGAIANKAFLTLELM